MNNLVKPITCRRCKGKGHVASRVQFGMCFGCNGWGKVEGDAATIAAAKKFATDRAAAARIILDLPVEGATATERVACLKYNGLARYGFDTLEAKDPARFRKAVQSVINGHPAVVPALVAFAKEN